MKARNLTLTYIGLRINGTKGVLHAFRHGKRELFWSRARGCIIGHQYRATQGPEGARLERYPQEVGEPVVSKETLEDWQFQDELAKAHRVRMRASKAASRRPPVLWPLIAPLNAKYHSIKGWDEREAFLDMVRHYIRLGKKKK